jgi:hypothetical protein
MTKGPLAVAIPSPRPISRELADAILLEVAYRKSRYRDWNMAPAFKSVDARKVGWDEGDRRDYLQHLVRKDLTGIDEVEQQQKEWTSRGR